MEEEEDQKEAQKKLKEFAALELIKMEQNIF